MTVNALLPADLDAAIALSSAEGWNQTAADWRRLVRLAPNGAFAAREGERLVGTVTALAYGRELAWIGMMVVDPGVRGRGIGGRLMRAALDHLHGLGVATAMLDATPAGRPLYESLGFVAEAEIARWLGVARAAGAAGATAAVRAARADDRAAIAACDRGAFGVDRTRVLDALIEEGAGDALVLASATGELAGYALVRAGRNATYIGPIVATDAAAALALVDGMLARFAGTEVCLDLHRGGTLAPDALAARGLTMRRGLTRMRRGPRTGTAVSRAIAASAGPELG
jgi:predicted N-acetyltransferase YhbS